jgi:uncharacterized membrane protein (DUF485 family)
MEHGPATEWQVEKSQAFKTKLGLIMFAIFTPIYLAFIFICVISPPTMAKDVGSLNVAIVYGFGIIILAIIQAVIYNIICSNKEKHDHVNDDTKGEVK